MFNYREIITGVIIFIIFFLTIGMSMDGCDDKPETKKITKDSVTTDTNLTEIINELDSILIVRPQDSVSNDLTTQDNVSDKDNNDTAKSKDIDGKGDDKKGEDKSTNELVDKAEESNAVIKAQEERIKALEATLKAQEVEKKTNELVAKEGETEAGKIHPNFKDSVSTIYASENSDVISAFEKIVKDGGIIVNDVTGEIGKADVEASETTEESQIEKIEAIAKEQNISFSQALKENWKEIK